MGLAGAHPRVCSADAGSGAHTGTYMPFVLMHDSKQSLPQDLQIDVSIEANGWKVSVEVAQKSRSPAAFLSPGRKRDSAPRDAAGPKNALRTPHNSAWRGSKGAPARPQFISVGKTGEGFCLPLQNQAAALGGHCA